MFQLLQNVSISFAISLNYSTNLASNLDQTYILRTGLTKRHWGFTKHGIKRAIERNVKPADILDAIRNPLSKGPIKTDSYGRSGQRIIGRKAEIVINPNTKKVISVNPTSSKKAERLLRGIGQ